MVYRTEHPKPQFVRQNWQNLNGVWQFEIDKGVSGIERKLYLNENKLTGTINVPFCPESKLSGIGDTDFLNCVWYRREIEITEEQLENLVILHFGAVDYETTVYVNEVEVGTHIGGYVSFSFDITEYLVGGTNIITVCAKDDARDRRIPSGKQSMAYASKGCFYTRTTGIWQTVWLEFVPRTHIKTVKYVTDINEPSVMITATLEGKGTFTAEAFYEGKAVGCASVDSFGGTACVKINLSEKHLWEVGHGRLYDLKLTYGDDEVTSYFGLRSLRLEGTKFLINEKSVFQRLVLDQGFYPDGIYTAPSDEELVADIDRSLAMGFNGARLHEKVFEERFLYHADRKGYIVWGEHANWGLNVSYGDSINTFLPEWLEIVERDFNHPAIVGWCPFNETWFDKKTNAKQDDAVIRNIYLVTKALDSTRPCIDTSGGIHVMTDIFDDHKYEQDPAKFAEYYANIKVDGTFPDRFKKYHEKFYKAGAPFFCSEYGGIGWSLSDNAWGYGQGPQTAEEFIERLKGLTDVLLDNDAMFGFCYTQLTDVEQEQNGLYTYDRIPKFAPELVYPIFSRKAAIED